MHCASKFLNLVDNNSFFHCKEIEKSILNFWGHFWGRGVVNKNCCQLFLEAPPIKVSANWSNFTVSPKKKNLHAFMTLCPLQYLFVPQ